MAGIYNSKLVYNVGHQGRVDKSGLLLHVTLEFAMQFCLPIRSPLKLKMPPKQLLGYYPKIEDLFT